MKRELVNFFGIWQLSRPRYYSVLAIVYLVSLAVGLFWFDKPVPPVKLPTCCLNSPPCPRPMVSEAPVLESREP